MNRTDTTMQDWLDVAVEEHEAWKRRLTITVDATRVAQARGKERDRLSKKLRVKGFRAGKIPPAIVEQRYGDLVDQRTIQRLVEEGYREAVRRQGLEPIGSPTFGQVQYGRGENLTFQVDIEIMPELKLKRLGGFRLSRPKVSVTAEDVEEVLQQLRAERGVWEPFPSVPQQGDLVAVRITNLDGSDEESPGAGVQDASAGAGPAAAAGSGSELYRFPLGAGYAIEDVEKAVETLSPGESGTFDVRFPEDFDDRTLAGLTRALQIELVEAKRRRLATLDDEFAAEVGDFETLDALRERIGTDLQRHREEEAEQKLRDETLDSIIEANPFEVPGSLVEGYLDRILGAGSDTGGGTGSEAQGEARRSVRPIAEQQLKRELVLEHVIQSLGLEASDAQVDEHIAREADRRGADPRDLRRQWMRKGGLEAVRRSVVVDAAFEHLKGLSKID